MRYITDIKEVHTVSYWYRRDDCWNNVHSIHRHHEYKQRSFVTVILRTASSALSGECCELMSLLLVAASAFHHNLPTCKVSTSELIGALLYFLKYRSTKKASLSNHQPTHAVKVTQPPIIHLISSLWHRRASAALRNELINAFPITVNWLKFAQTACTVR